MLGNFTPLTPEKKNKSSNQPNCSLSAQHVRQRATCFTNLHVSLYVHESFTLKVVVLLGVLLVVLLGVFPSQQHALSQSLGGLLCWCVSGNGCA